MRISAKKIFLNMKNFQILFLLLLILSTTACKKERKQTELPEITSKEYIDELLFVNKNDYQIQTSEPATFSSNDSSITISAAGLIQRITSGELVSIEVTWPEREGMKTTLYAVGATDNNHVNPFIKYHAAESTDPYNQYIQGWKTLRKLPVSTETYAIILRHADADNGKDFSIDTGPANWWKSCDSTLARQLNQQGKQRAKDLGRIFKDLGYPISRVYSSEFCRALKTAQLINAVTDMDIKIDGRINHPAYNISKKSLFNGLQEIIQPLPVDNKLTLVSTHHPINEIGKGVPSFPEVSVFNWTGAYFIKIAPDKSLTYEGAVSWGMFKYWRDLKLKKM